MYCKGLPISHFRRRAGLLSQSVLRQTLYYEPTTIIDPYGSGVWASGLGWASCPSAAVVLGSRQPPSSAGVGVVRVIVMSSTRCWFELWIVADMSS